MRTRLIVFLMLIALVVVACAPIESDVSVRSESISGNLKLVYVESMPCVIYSSVEKGGVTCDWSRWQE